MSKEYGWDTVNKPDGGSSGGGRFLTLKDGDAVRVRILDEAPLSIMVHNISTVDTDGNPVFRSIPATKAADENVVLQLSTRFPAKRRFAIRVAVLDDDGEITDFKILEGGKQIFRPLKKLVDLHGSINDFDVIVSREGEGRETEYSVQATPKSFDVDVESAIESMEEDEAMDLDVAYPDVTGEMQEQMLAEAKIDLTVDHVQVMAEDMDPKVAGATRVPFGKYEGKTIKEVGKIDTGYLLWMSENVTTNDEVAAAAMAYVASIGALDKGSAPKRSLPKKKKSKPAPDPEPEEETEDEDEELAPWTLKQSPEDYLARWEGQGGKHVELARAHVLAAGGTLDEPEDEEEEVEEDEHDPPTNSGSSNDTVRDVMTLLKERYSSAMEILQVIRSHSAEGKSRVSDLTTEELDNLLATLME